MSGYSPYYEEAVSEIKLGSIISLKSKLSAKLLELEIAEENVSKINADIKKLQSEMNIRIARQSYHEPPKK